MINEQHEGFTFLELTMVMVILSVISLLAYPAVNNQLAKNEGNQIKRILQMSFKQAKTVSYSNKKTVSLCLLNNNDKCDSQKGHVLILFYDDNNSKNFEQAFDQLVEQYNLNLSYGDVALKAGRRNLIQFWQDTGMPRGYFGHIKYCSDIDASYSFQYSFSQTGRTTYKPANQYDPSC